MQKALKFHACHIATSFHWARINVVRCGRFGDLRCRAMNSVSPLTVPMTSVVNGGTPNALRSGIIPATELQFGAPSPTFGEASLCFSKRRCIRYSTALSAKLHPSRLFKNDT